MVAGAVSQLVFGLNILFPYGLAIGVCVASIGLHLISATIEKAIAANRRGPVIVGFIIRVVLYIVAFYLAATTSGLTVFGAAIGLLLPHLVMYARFALRPAIRRKLGKDPKHAYITDTRSRVFIKEPWLVRYSKGKAYVTHRHYRKVRVEGK